MQGVENVGEVLVRKAMVNSLYPGKCGYKSNYGGKFSLIYHHFFIVKFFCSFF